MTEKEAIIQLARAIRRLTSGLPLDARELADEVIYKLEKQPAPAEPQAVCGTCNGAGRYFSKALDRERKCLDCAEPQK